MLKGIAELFADLDGYAGYQDAMEEEFPRARAKAVAVTKAWREANPKRHQQNARKARATYRKRYPERVAKLKRGYIDRNRAHMREVWKRNSRAYKLRKLAAKGSR